MGDKTEVDNYKAQLQQVEAALAIDEKNEDLQKLKQDLLEVISLTEELFEKNHVADEHAAAASEECPVVVQPVKGDEWKIGDRVQAMRLDGEYHNGTLDMIADDKISCTVKFDNSGSVDVVKLAEIRTPMEIDFKKDVEEPQEGGNSSRNQTTNNKVLTRDEIERRREIKKKKLLKKKQRMKEFEEAREAGKQRWQQFYKKGTLKGKHKIKGLNKKSIFASREDGKGKIGIGTCGTSGVGMTEFTPASAYMYKK